MVQISSVLLRAKSSSELSLIFICFYHHYKIKSLILLRSSLYFFVFSLLSLIGTSVKYLFSLISLKHPFILPMRRYKGFTLLIFTYFESLIVTYSMKQIRIFLHQFSSILILFGSKSFIVIIPTKK